MNNTRRIGSITLGITLVLCGAVYLMQMIIPGLNYFVILRFWPVVLIILGIEILIENNRSKSTDVHFIYDFASIIMIMATGAFTMCMAGLEYLIRTGHINI